MSTLTDATHRKMTGLVTRGFIAETKLLRSQGGLEIHPIETVRITLLEMLKDKPVSEIMLLLNKANIPMSQATFYRNMRSKDGLSIEHVPSAICLIGLLSDEEDKISVNEGNVLNVASALMSRGVPFINMRDFTLLCIFIETQCGGSATELQIDFAYQYVCRKFHYRAGLDEMCN